MVAEESGLEEQFETVKNVSCMYKKDNLQCSPPNFEEFRIRPQSSRYLRSGAATIKNLSLVPQPLKNSIQPLQVLNKFNYRFHISKKFDSGPILCKNCFEVLDKMFTACNAPAELA